MLASGQKSVLRRGMSHELGHYLNSTPGQGESGTCYAHAIVSATYSAPLRWSCGHPQIEKFRDVIITCPLYRPEQVKSLACALDVSPREAAKIAQQWLSGYRLRDGTLLVQTARPRRYCDLEYMTLMDSSFFKTAGSWVLGVVRRTLVSGQDDRSKQGRAIIRSMVDPRSNTLGAREVMRTESRKYSQIEIGSRHFQWRPAPQTLKLRASHRCSSTLNPTSLKLKAPHPQTLTPPSLKLSIKPLNPLDPRNSAEAVRKH